MRFLTGGRILLDPNPAGGGGGSEPTVEQLEAKMTEAFAALEKTPTAEGKTVALKALEDYKVAVAAKAAASAEPVAGDEATQKALKGLKEDLFKQKETTRKLLEEKAKRDAEVLEAQKRKDIEDQNFRKLWTESEEARKVAEAKNAAIVAAYVADKRLSALQDAAIKAGMRPQVIGDLANMKLDTVSTDVRTGDGVFEVVVNGAPETIEALKQMRPWLFGSGNGNPNINDLPPGDARRIPGTPTIPPPGSLSGQALLDLEKKTPDVYAEYLRQTIKAARKN